MMAQKMPGPGSNTLTVIGPKTLDGILSGRLDVNCRQDGKSRGAKLLCNVGNVQNIRVSSTRGAKPAIKASVSGITIVAERSGKGNTWAMKKIM